MELNKIVPSIKMLDSLCWKAWERKFHRNSEADRKESEGEVKIRSGIGSIERDPLGTRSER